MAKRDKQYEQHQAGMLYALDVAKRKGIDGLEEEIRKRGIWKVRCGVSESYLDALVNEISNNIFNNIFAASLEVLHRIFGFGGVRLKRYEHNLMLVAAGCLEKDWKGETYQTLGDLAEWYRDEYDCYIDPDRTIATERARIDESRFIEKKSLVQWLNDHGYEDASKEFESLYIKR